MRLTTKLLGLGGIVAAAILVDRRLRARRSRPDDSYGLSPDVAIVDADVIVGIAAVDPEPLVGITEAIDPDEVEAAHREPREQRARMPVRGKNVP